jgi:hypothetical protein
MAYNVSIAPEDRRWAAEMTTKGFKQPPYAAAWKRLPIIRQARALYWVVVYQREHGKLVKGSERRKEFVTNSYQGWVMYGILRGYF